MRHVSIFVLLISIFLILRKCFPLLYLSLALSKRLGTWYTEQIVAQMIYPTATCYAYILSKPRIQYRDGWHTAQCGLPVASFLSLWMKGGGFSQMEHPLFSLEREEMKPGGCSQRSANHNLTLTQSITSGECQAKERWVANETADGALISVWIMMSEGECQDLTCG